MQRALLYLGAFGLLASASTIPLQRRDEGCGKAHGGGYNNNPANHKLDSGRTYTMWVPEDYDPNQQYPLIVDYHGRYGDGNKQHDNSQYDKNSRGKEYLVAYPDGIDQAWGGASYASTSAEEDLEFTDSLVDHLKQTYCVDTNRIYASGKSNGGGFVDTLACSPQGDQFAAFAMAAPALYTDVDDSTDCPKKRAILEAHGDADGTICYAGNADERCANKDPLPNIGDWVSRWGQRDCGSSAQPDSPGPSDAPESFSATSYSCDGFEEVVKHYHGSAMGHCWPSDDGTNTDSSKGDCGDRSMEYTEFVMDFFGKWDLGSAPQN